MTSRGSAPSPGRARQLARGLARRCPRCGSGGLFDHWLHMRPSCPRCGLVFERAEGDWTGAMVINFALTTAVFVVVLIALVAATAPTIPVAPLLAVLVPITALGPLVFYPVSKTLWVAIERGVLDSL
jgi:uncharacterized protein (DUF983 family)